MNSKNSLKNIILNADKYLLKNNLTVAKDLYNQVLDTFPKHVDSLNKLAAIHFQLGDLKKSIEFFKKVIAINPNNPEVHKNLRVCYSALGDLDNSWKHYEEFLRLKSSSVKTKANLDKLIPQLIKKLKKQNDVPTFFDNATLRHLLKDKNSETDYCDIFLNSQNSRQNRFITHSDRLRISKSFLNNRSFEGLPLLASQGTHSLIKWKDIPIFKTTFDLNIYMMIIEEIKPDIIIELGSGLGGSAIWLADIAKALDLNTHIFSLDIHKPELKHPNVTFLKQDLNNIEDLKKAVSWDKLKGKKILIEDAHTNILNVLNFFNTHLNKNDYLIIEDSGSKGNTIKQFVNGKDDKYKADQFYLDFFGTNITCCVDSIFKCF